MPTFKDYTMDQLQLPLSFEDFIPENHLVRVVNTIVDSLELTPLYDRYKDGGCPYAAECKNTENPRTIRVSHRLNELKRKANENLCSEKGLKLRSQRVVEVEQTFGRIKGCWSFRRFLLRGKDKVKIEWGLIAIAHNITKMALEG